MKTVGAVVAVFVAWVVVLGIVDALLHDYLQSETFLRNALIAADVVGFGTWLVVTGRLARLFRKV